MHSEKERSLCFKASVTINVDDFCTNASRVLAFTFIRMLLQNQLYESYVTNLTRTARLLMPVMTYR